MAEEEWGGDGPLAESQSGVPEPRLCVMEFLHQCDAVVPGQLCKRRLHNPQVWPGLNRNSSRWSRLITHYPHLPFRRYLTADARNSGSRLVFTHWDYSRTDAPQLYDQQRYYHGKLSTNPYDPDSTSSSRWHYCALLCLPPTIRFITRLPCPSRFALTVGSLCNAPS